MTENRTLVAHQARVDQGDCVASSEGQLCCVEEMAQGGLVMIEEKIVRDLISAASCYVQCSDLAVGDDRKSCQSHLSDAVMRAREVLG